MNACTRLRVVTAALALTLLAGCGGSSGGSDPCANAGQVLAVGDVMQDDYFWNDEPDQDRKYVSLVSSDFETPEALLDFLRYRPEEFDRRFSVLTTVEDDNRFFGPGEFVGYGFSFRLDENSDELWITQVFSNSPAEMAGFARGVRIVAVDGRPIVEIEAAEGVGEAFGAPEIGVTQSFRLQPAVGPSFATVATKDLVTIDPVPQFRVIDVAGSRIGYLEFRSFISTAPAKLRNAFGAFAAAGITDVIVDVRYNGGGLVSVANDFASLLGGPGNVGLVQSFRRYNMANSQSDKATEFTSQPNAIDLESIVFITTDDSASATELVINALKPYLDVTLVGTRTFGKPVGQDAIDFCERRLRLVTFETINANQQGGYFDGLPVDCPASDDLALPIGDEFEASLAAALTRITTGACPSMGANRGARLLALPQQAQRAPITRRIDASARTYAHAY